MSFNWFRTNLGIKYLPSLWMCWHFFYIYHVALVCFLPPDFAYIQTIPLVNLIHTCRIPLLFPCLGKVWKCQVLSCVRLFAKPRAVAHQAPCPGNAPGNGLPFPSPGDLPDPGIEPKSSTLQADSLPSLYHLNHQGSPCLHHSKRVNCAMTRKLPHRIVVISYE